MSVPDEYSTYCRKSDCETYNVEGYCKTCIVDFFIWCSTKRLELTTENFDKLWAEFDN